MSNFKPGRIIVYTGPMFSRKTKSMVIELERAMLGKKSFVAVRPQRDSRSIRALDEELAKTLEPYGVDVGKLVFVVAGQVQMRRLLLDHRDISILAIDEAQFFDGSWMLDEVCYAAWGLGIDVLISGLDLDYARHGFNLMPQLIALADEVHKLTAVCFKCGNAARFTQRISGSNIQVEIGDREYEARCGKCFYYYVAEAS